MATDRRIPTRLRVRWPVVMITAKGVLVAETGDISGEGAFIRCKTVLRPREKLRLFIMAPNQQPLEVPAEVAWSNPSGSEKDSTPSGMGLRFTQVSSDNRQSLREMLGRYYEKKIKHTAVRK